MWKKVLIWVVVGVVAYWIIRKFFGDDRITLEELANIK
jgi:hypothetical protein